MGKKQKNMCKYVHNYASAKWYAPIIMYLYKYAYLIRFLNIWGYQIMFW